MIEYEKRAMIEAEDKYTFRQSTQISMQTGLIGHLRADMDTDGNGFFSSWFDFREELKTDEFKAEFDEVINSLREEGDILHNRRALAKYCYCTPQSRMQEEPGYYGVRVDTEKYAYLLRLNPDRGEYNLYCYCYRRDWLDQHLKDAEKGIRFIDSHYKELFRIPDGGKVKIHYSWNEDQIRTCRYIDDYHVEIGSNLYHICEFAERMEYGGHTCEPVRDNLPERCYSVLSGSDEIIDKSYSDYGVPYIDEACMTGISNNLVIYGHHMNDGSMFADLCKYADADFCREHPTIAFDTLSSLGKYEVVAAFKFNTNRETFKYNEYTLMDEDQFDEFMENARARQLYDTGVTAEYGDQLLTLSTCEYTYPNGRFVVVAKKV